MIKEEIIVITSIRIVVRNIGLPPTSTNLNVIYYSGNFSINLVISLKMC